MYWFDNLLAIIRDFSLIAGMVYLIKYTTSIKKMYEDAIKEMEQLYGSFLFDISQNEDEPT